MFKYLAAVAVAILLAGCPAGAPMKGVSDERTQDDVIDAWNAVCASSNFASISETDDLTEITTSMKYGGQAWALDRSDLADDMADWLDEPLVSIPPLPEGDEDLETYTTDPLWFP